MTDRIKGKVARLYVRTDETIIRLGETDDVLPKNGYFHLRIADHANYNALYSLALAAAINRYTLAIDAAKDITPNEEAVVDYMVVDW